MKNNKTEMEPGTYWVYMNLHNKILPYKRKVRLNRFEISLNEHEVLISERSFVAGTDLSTRRLRRILKGLKDNDYITLKTTNKGTIIKINDPSVTAEHLVTKHRNES